MTPGIGYALMQLPSGSLGDRWGARRALALYAILWSVATGLTALARDFYSIVVLWMLMGVAEGQTMLEVRIDGELEDRIPVDVVAQEVAP